MTTLTFGKVPQPGMDIMDIPSSVNTAWNDLGQRMPRFVVLHRMIGTLTGTDAYFRADARTRALTDYGLDNTTGRIIRWNDPWGRRAPWASGPWQSPPGDGIALVAKYGVNVINRDGVSIEVAGNYDSPVSPAAYAELVSLVAYHADQAKVPHTTFPINPPTGVSFVLWHSEFTSEKPCPGPVVKALTDQLIEDVTTTLKRYQTGGTVTTPTKPTTPATPPAPEKPVEAGPGGIPYKTLFGPSYDHSGPVSTLWRANGERTGRYPELQWHKPDNTAFLFSDGSIITAKDGKASYIEGVK